MSIIKENYDLYIEELEKEGFKEEAIEFEEYMYMYSLYLQKLGVYAYGEEELNNELEIIENLSKVDFFDVRELGSIIAPRAGGLNLELEVRESEVHLDRYNVTSRENEREYIEVDAGIVEFDLNDFLKERSTISVKDGFRLVLYKIKNNFEDKYKVVAFRNFGSDYLLDDNSIIDTYYEGIDLKFKNGDPNFMNYIKGDRSIQSYMDAVEFFNEISNLSNDKEEILYGEKRYLTNKYIPNEPMVYELEDKIYIQYISIQKEEGEYSSFIKNIILFNKDDYSFKKFRENLGKI